MPFIEALATETKSDPKALKKLIGILQRAAGLNPEDRKLLAQTRQAQLDQHEQTEHQRELKIVQKHFPELRGNKKALQALERLAYTAENAKKPLVELYLDNKEKILGKKADGGSRSGEYSRGGSQKQPLKDKEKIIEEENWSDLSDAEFLKTGDEIAKGHRNRVFTPAPTRTRIHKS